MQVTFKVTQEDIDHGKANSCTRCPVARALRRTIPNLFDNVSIVMPQYISLRNMSANNPPSLRTWIMDFDAGQQMLPATFTVDFFKSHSL